MKADPLLRLELRICRDHGISHSQFLGGKPRWTDLDRDKVKAFYLLEAEECPDCHTLREDWLDDNGEPLREPVWTPDFRDCPGCEEYRRAGRHITQDQRERGRRVILTPLVDFVARQG